MAPIANLFDAWDGVSIDSKWTQVSGVWVESGGRVCSTTSAASELRSTDTYSFQNSLAFVEFLGSYGTTVSQLRISNSADATDYLAISYDGAGNLSMTHVENGVAQYTVSIAHDPTTMRWVRLRNSSGGVYFETSPDGATWTTQHSATQPTWISSVYGGILTANDTGACFDNFNVTPASSRPVAVGSEFTVTDGKLGLDRCGQPDEAWGYSCSESAYNALRKSENPPGLWVQPPTKNDIGNEVVVKTTSGTEEVTVITMTLTNPDTCRSMHYYLPLVAGMSLRTNTIENDTPNVSWVLGVKVSGVDNPDEGFTPLAQNDFNATDATHVWRGEADYYWTAAPGASTTVTVVLKAAGEGSFAKLVSYSARLGWIGLSVMD